MTYEEQLKIKALVSQSCAENPQFFKDVIDAAISGVKHFAEVQSDYSSKMAYMLSDVLDNNENLKLRFFKKSDLLASMRQLHGTVWFDNYKKENNLP